MIILGFKLIGISLLALVVLSIAMVFAITAQHGGPSPIDMMFGTPKSSIVEETRESMNQEQPIINQEEMVTDSYVDTLDDVPEEKEVTKGTLPYNPADVFKGTVTKVVDGDTLDIDNTRIRLTLVNTPERGEDGWGEATRFVKEHCPVGSTAVFDPDSGQSGGSYGRTIGVVWCYGTPSQTPITSLNAMLMSEGLAEISTKFCSKSEFNREPWARAGGC